MRKHFLLLMLLTLLPLASWAAISITTDPELNTAVDYDGTGKQVIKTALVATGEGNLTIYYAVNTTGVQPDAADENTWYVGIDNVNLKVNAANTYYAYYKIVSDNGGEGTQINKIGTSFVINKVPATVATNPTAKNLTYSGIAQQLVKAGTSLTGTLKYSLTNNGTDWSEDIPTGTGAGDYNVYYMVEGDANHTDYQPMTGTPATAVKVPVTINKKNLRAKAHGFTAAETIFGVFKKNTAVTIDYDGWVNNETVLVLDHVPTAAIATDVNNNTVNIGGTDYIQVGDYEEALEVTSTGDDDNYEIICLNNDLSISKAKIKVDLAAKVLSSAVYGSADAALTSWEIEYEKTPGTYLTVKRQTDLNGTYIAVDAADFGKVLKTRTATVNKVPHTYFNSPIVTTRANTSVEVGQYLLTLSGAEATDNTIIEEQTNSTELKFQITAANLTIKAGNKWKVYGAADPKEQDGSWAFTVKSGGNPYNGLSEAQNAAIKAGLTRAYGEAVGDYKIDFSDELKANELFAGNYTITWTPGWLTIEKQDLTITAEDQTLYVGNTVAKLGQVENVNYSVEGLQFEDEATVALAFGTETNANETMVPVNGEKELNTAGNYNKGIKIILSNAAALADNYNIIYVPGKLTVVDATTNLVLSLTSDNAEAIESADTHEVDVTFGAGTLKGQTWHTMVLPFPVKTTELVSQLKNSTNQPVFAIINVFDNVNSTLGNIRFVMEWSQVPANTPFMIKTAEDVDMSKVTFVHKTIAYTATPATAADADGNQFIGTYSKKSIIKENNIFFGWYDSNNTKVWRQPVNNAHEMQPLQAYLKYAEGSFNSAAPVITFEDLIDGNLTAIKSFTIEGGSSNVAKIKEGWYTLNGAKLQGAPTEKGVYIKNGKKIVIR